MAIFNNWINAILPEISLALGVFLFTQADLPATFWR